MTNFEWLKEEISKMNMEEFYTLKNSPSPWCKANQDTSSCNSLCRECAEAWANQKYENPMPELKNGMFVEYYDKRYDTSPFVYNARGYGVVVDDKIVCQDGSCFYGLKDEDTINCITKIFNADSFNGCDDGACIWERN